MLRMRLFVAAVAAVVAFVVLATQLAVAAPATDGCQAKPAAGRAAPSASIKTSAGEIVDELYHAQSPRTGYTYMSYCINGF